MNSVWWKTGAGCLAAACLASGCSSPSPSYSNPTQSASARSPSPFAAGATRGGELQALTARGIVNAITKMGFETPNPVDTTAQECPAAGCDQSIVTDTLRVKSFATTGKAELYAQEHGLDQEETIVVSFAPPVPLPQQRWYWSAIKKLLG